MFSGLPGQNDIIAFLGVGNLAGFRSQLNSAGNAVDQAAQQMNRVLNTAILAGAAAFAGATVAAASFETQMANVHTLLGAESTEFETLNSEVLEFATRLPASVSDLTGALYQVVSATVPPSQAMGVLETSIRAASAGLAETQETFEMFSSVVKGYGMEWDEVNRISDIAFQTIKLGQTTMGELASSIGGTVPLASALGVSFEEVMGAMAALSGVTGTTAEVATQLEGIFTLLAKEPTAELQAALEGLGVATGRELIEKFEGLSGAMDALRGYTDSTGQEVTELIGRKEAMVGFLALSIITPLYSITGQFRA